MTDFDKHRARFRFRRYIAFKLRQFRDVPKVTPPESPGPDRKKRP